jgi:hypothetical protein
MYDNTKYDTTWLQCIGWVIAVVAVIVVIGCLTAIIVQHTATDAYVEENQERYKSLTYQLENDLYDNDNDIGKKALYDEIREWNEELAYFQAIQDNFWVGIFYPNVYDQFEFIDYGAKMKGGAE